MCINIIRRVKKKKVKKSHRAPHKSSKHKRNYKYSFSYSSFIGIVTIIAIFLFAVNTIFSPLKQNNTYNTLGTTTYLAKGDDSDLSGFGSSGSSDSEDDPSGSSDSDSSGPSDSSTKTETRDSTSNIRTQTEIKEDESLTEVRLSEEERIRTRTKDGRTIIDITAGGVKTRLEYRDDRVIIKAEQEDGEEVELEDDTIFKIEDRLGANGIKIATAGAEKFVIQRGNTGALTNFPLSIDLSTNSLIVNTPAGEKNVAVLPDQAVQNIIAANIVSRIGGQKVVDAALNQNLASISQLVILGLQNGVPVYEINGISDQRLLGFIPVIIEKSVAVSAETGQVVSTQKSLPNQLLDFVSF